MTTYLHKLEPSFVSYLLSFFVIAAWWNTHHRLFSSLIRYDETVVRLNSFFLLVISITPFLVSVLFTYGPSGFEPGSVSSRLAVVLYGAVQTVGGAVLLVIWRHSTRQRLLVSPTLPEEWIRGTEQVQLLNVAVFAASMGIAVVSPLTAELLWIVIIFGVRRHLWRRRAPGQA